MKEIELYDIITLGDESEYTILKMLEYSGKKYYLIAPIDKEENPDMENVKIVEAIKKEEKIMIQEETDENRLKELSKLFLNLLKEDLEDTEI
ncbi:MAG: DUF1292 domain-containing protein [Erysipelotrichaceae bacterium]|nr:DUF1292 domain-containing protein [Erysipelotrichaceae bacterium]